LHIIIIIINTTPDRDTARKDRRRRTNTNQTVAYASCSTPSPLTMCGGEGVWDVEGAVPPRARAPGPDYPMCTVKGSIPLDRAGLSTVPVVPWEGAPLPDPPPSAAKFLTRCFDV